MIMTKSTGYFERSSMKKNIVRKTIIFLCCIIILSVSNQIIHAEELERPIEDEWDDPYQFVQDTACSLSVVNGTATIHSLVNGNLSTISTSVTVYLEKLVSGSWEPYTSWSHSGGRNLDNTDYCYNLSHGAYRVWMSVSATGLSGNESFNVDGNTVGY